MTEAVQPVHDRAALLQLQSLPLEAKVRMSINRIRQAYEHWNGQVYVSVSGGLDSTVLAHIVRSIYPDMPLAFFDTGLEYPDNRTICKELGAEFIRPKRTFLEVIGRVGYPVVSKRTAQYVSEVQAAYRRGYIDAVEHARSFLVKLKLDLDAGRPIVFPKQCPKCGVELAEFFGRETTNDPTK